MSAPERHVGTVARMGVLRPSARALTASITAMAMALEPARPTEHGAPRGPLDLDSRQATIEVVIERRQRGDHDAVRTRVRSAGGHVGDERYPATPIRRPRP